MTEPDPTGAVGRAGPIHHVAIAVRDADAAVDTFTSVLGHVVRADELVPAAGVRLVHLGVPGGSVTDAELQLVQPVRPGPVADFLHEHGEGLHHVCFATDDIAATAGRPGAGRRPTAFTGARGLPCAFLTVQPHGARIELVQLAAAPPGRPDPRGTA